MKLQIEDRNQRFVGIVAKLCLTCILGAALVGCATIDPDSPEAKLRKQFYPRWDVNEIDIDDVNPAEKVGRNIRDGFVGIIDNFAQGIFSFFLIGPTTGYIVQKLATILGDVIGLIDDNAYTEHVFKGIISRQFLKFGAAGRNFLSNLGAVHNNYTFEGPEFTVLDYVGDKTFHTKVYGTPSGVTTLFGAITADFLIRPAGNFIRIFGMRDQAQTIEDFGLDLIQKSTEPAFL